MKLYYQTESLSPQTWQKENTLLLRKQIKVKSKKLFIYEI